MVIAFLLAIAVVAGFGAGPIGAAGQAHYAGVVVRHGDGRMAYAYVGFTEESISGIELLKRTGLDVVTVAFGGLGEGVCSIDAHGCPATDCRKRVCQGPTDESPFWQYFRQTSPGVWEPLALGASSTKVRDGDLDGWSWTPRDAGLPALSLADVARLAGYDGRGFAGAATPGPGAALRREGAPTVGHDDPAWRTVGLAGAVVLVALLVVVAALVRRRRAPA